MTQGSLILALILVLTINPRLRIRPNWFLGLYTVLAVSSLMMSIRFVGIGTDFRSVRLIVFLFVLVAPHAMVGQARSALFAQSDVVPRLGL